VCVAVMKYHLFREKPVKIMSARRGSTKSESFGVVELDEPYTKDGVVFKIRPCIRVEYGHAKGTAISIPEFDGKKHKNRQDFRFNAFNERWSFNRVAGFLFGQGKRRRKLTWDQFQTTVTVGDTEHYHWQVDHLVSPNLYCPKSLEVITRKENLRRSIERQQKEREEKTRAEHLRKNPKQKTRSSTRRL